MKQVRGGGGGRCVETPRGDDDLPEAPRPAEGPLRGCGGRGPCGMCWKTEEAEGKPLTGRPTDGRQHFAGTGQHRRSLRGTGMTRHFTRALRYEAFLPCWPKKSQIPEPAAGSAGGADGARVGTERDGEGEGRGAHGSLGLRATSSPSRSSRWGEPRRHRPGVQNPLTQAGEPRAWEPGDGGHRERQKARFCFVLFWTNKIFYLVAISEAAHFKGK